jgi:hypothetical protein
VAWLRLHLHLDARSRGYFERYREDAEAHGASTSSLDAAIA